MTWALKKKSTNACSLEILTIFTKCTADIRIFKSSSGDSSVQVRWKPKGLAQMEIQHHYGVCEPYEHQPYAMQSGQRVRGALLKSLFYTATILHVSNIIGSFANIPSLKKY